MLKNSILRYCKLCYFDKKYINSYSCLVRSKTEILIKCRLAAAMFLFVDASTSGSRHCGESDFPLTPWSQTGVHDKNSNSSMEDSDAHKCMLRSHHASDEENAKIMS